MDSRLFLRENETYDDFYHRCNNLSHFDCSEEEMLWWLMGSRRLPLTEIVPISIVLVVIFLTGVIGNVSVCVVIVKHPGLHTATNYYLFSLAVSDLLLLMFGKYFIDVCSLTMYISISSHRVPVRVGKDVVPNIPIVANFCLPSIFITLSYMDADFGVSSPFSQIRHK